MFYYIYICIIYISSLIYVYIYYVIVLIYVFFLEPPKYQNISRTTSSAYLFKGLTSLSSTSQYVVIVTVLHEEKFFSWRDRRLQQGRVQQAG